MDAPSHLAAYLARLGLSAAPRADAAGLAAVQAAHRQSIPFENIGVRLGQSIACDSAAVFAKLVEQQRGGFCFEHNQLFADMLGALGFTARLLLARVLLGQPAELPPRTHCLVLVTLAGEDWIADAGFGGSYAPPLRLTDGAAASTGDGAQHRLRHLGHDGALRGAWLLERQGPAGATDGRTRSDSAWEPQYAFDLAHVAPADMALGCHWSATHPASRFTALTVASLCLPDGFISLVDRNLSIWRAGMAPEKRALADSAEYAAVLRDRFGLALDAPDVAKLPLFPA